jgi:hypothetical protein
MKQKFATTMFLLAQTSIDSELDVVSRDALRKILVLLGGSMVLFLGWKMWRREIPLWLGIGGLILALILMLKVPILVFLEGTPL